MGSGPRRPRLAACAPARLMQRAVSGPAASRPCGPSVGYWQAQPRRLAREVLGAKLTDDDAFDLVRLVECQCYVVGRLLPPRGARRRRRQPFVTALGIQQVLCFVHFILPRTQSEWATAVAVSSVAWVCQGGGRVQQDGSCTCACTGARLVHGFTRSAAAAALLTSSLADTSEAGSKFPQPARKRHGAHDHDAARPTTTAGNGKMRATGQGTHGTGKSGTGTGSGMLGARIYALGQRRSRSRCCAQRRGAFDGRLQATSSPSISRISLDRMALVCAYTTRNTRGVPISSTPAAASVPLQRSTGPLHGSDVTRLQDCI